MRVEDFSPIVPTKQQTETMNRFNQRYQDLAQSIIDETNVPVNVHRTAALRLLLESKMTLIHGITHL